jgi:hypothetical protein
MDIKLFEKNIKNLEGSIDLLTKDIELLKKDYDTFNKLIVLAKEAIPEVKKIPYNKVKITCECGCILTKRNYIKHKTSNKHQLIMYKKNEKVDWDKIKYI